MCSKIPSRRVERGTETVQSGVIELDNPRYHSNESVSVLGDSPIWIGARRDEVWYWSLYPQISGMLIITLIIIS